MRAGSILTFLLIFACFLLLPAKRISKRTVIVTRQAPDPPIIRQIKPRNGPFPRPLSEYEKCKLACRKDRDQKAMEEYVAQLKEELTLVEEKVATEQTSMWKERGDLQDRENGEDGVLTRTAKAAKKIVADAAHKMTGADEEDGEETVPTPQIPTHHMTDTEQAPRNQYLHY